MAKQTLNSIEKRLSGGGQDTPRLDMSQFIKMAEKDPDDGFKLEILPQIKELFKEFGKPGETLDEFILRIDEETLKRIQLNDGGKVIDFLKALHKKENKTIVMVTHDEDLARNAQRIEYLYDGQIVKGRKHL